MCKIHPRNQVLSVKHVHTHTHTHTHGHICKNPTQMVNPRDIAGEHRRRRSTEFYKKCSYLCMYVCCCRLATYVCMYVVADLLPMYVCMLLQTCYLCMYVCCCRLATYVCMYVVADLLQAYLQWLPESMHWQVSDNWPPVSPEWPGTATVSVSIVTGQRPPSADCQHLAQWPGIVSVSVSIVTQQRPPSTDCQHLAVTWHCHCRCQHCDTAETFKGPPTPGSDLALPLSSALWHSRDLLLPTARCWQSCHEWSSWCLLTVVGYYSVTWTGCVVLSIRPLLSHDNVKSSSSSASQILQDLQCLTACCLLMIHCGMCDQYQTVKSQNDGMATHDTWHFCSTCLCKSQHLSLLVCCVSAQILQLWRFHTWCLVDLEMIWMILILSLCLSVSFIGDSRVMSTLSCSMMCRCMLATECIWNASECSFRKILWTGCKSVRLHK